MLPLMKAVAAVCLLMGSFTASWMTFQQFWREETQSTKRGVELVESELANGKGFSYEFRYNGKMGTYTDAINMLIEGNTNFLTPLNQAITQRYSSVYWECAPITANAASKEPFRFVVLPAVALDGRIADTEAFSSQFVSLRKAQKKDPFTSFLNLRKDSLFVVPVPSTPIDIDLYPREDVLSSLITDHDRTISMLRSSSDLASFIRRSNPALVAQLWAKVGQELHQALEATRQPEPNPLLERISAEFLAGGSFNRSPMKKEGNLRKVATGPATASTATSARPVNAATLPFKPGSSIWLSTAGVSTAWLHVRLDSKPKYYQYKPFREVPKYKVTYVDI